MPEEGVRQLKHEDILSFEEIAEITEKAVIFGIDKIRITGGEPLVRKGIISLIELLSAIEGVNDLSLTTNGLLLEEFAKPIFDAGLKRINISLDTVNEQKYFDLTRGGDLKKVLRGIEKAKETGFSPIKVNCVVKTNSADADADKVREYCEKNQLQIRYIHQMDLENGHFSVVDGGSGGDCLICNRLRLTADGKIKPCLFNDIEFDVRKLGVEEALKQAVLAKPECGSVNMNSKFYNIGG
jgi:cyclic pyranopterin phosphate synthase